MAWLFCMVAPATWVTILFLNVVRKFFCWLLRLSAASPEMTV